MKQQETNHNHAGWLILIGGSDGTELSPQIFGAFAEVAGGKNARLLIVPTASEESDRTVEKYRRFFGSLGVQQVQSLQISGREEADRPENLLALEQATGILLTGGDQLRLISMLRGSKWAARLIQRFREGLHVAGTSAGAMAIGDPVIVRGEGKDFYVWESIPAVAGLEIYPGIVVDTHLVVRGRLGRLLTLVAGHPKTLGIGIEEDCAAFISPENVMTQRGAGIIMLVDGSQIGSNNIPEIRTGDPISVEGFRLHILSGSDRFDLPSRKFLKNQ